MTENQYCTQNVNCRHLEASADGDLFLICIFLLVLRGIFDNLRS